MQLSTYLKRFKNIAWYHSAGKDALSMVCLSYKSLREYGLSKDEVPDCFIFTDYLTYSDYQENKRFFLDLDEYEDETSVNYSESDFKATAFNIKELDKLILPFDEELVAFNYDRYYGRVFTCDVLIEHPVIGRAITKLIYVVTENTTFAFNFLLKNKIKVKYMIHSRYGHSFGGGKSNGGFMCHLFKELGTKYFASDMNEHYNYDVADKYLVPTQRETLPVLTEIDNFNTKYGWCGHQDTILYEVKGFKTLDIRGLRNTRFIIRE